MTRDNVHLFPRSHRGLGIGLLVFAWFWGAFAAAQGQPATNRQPRVYFFTMDGCGPCKEMEPGVQQLLRQGYPITTIDARRQNEWAQRFQVTSTPTTVFVVGDQEVGRQSGIVSAEEIAQWCLAHRQTPPASASTAPSRVASAPPPAADKFTLELRATPPGNSTRTRGGVPAAIAPLNKSEMANTTQGTRVPGSTAEQQAMAATVRLRVEDAEGFSFGTGTVVHVQGSEALVLTCGHLFRDWRDSSRITAEIGWLSDQPETVAGELLSFESEVLDVALVAIRLNRPVQPVTVALNPRSVQAPLPVFSIGCDRGAPPTIRRSQIKNLATYDGAPKYDIWGRPVVGRSGGGLFNEAGELIGVCNAAAVHEDEGVFSSLENIHQQIATAGLRHLFQPADLGRGERSSLAQDDSRNQAQLNAIATSAAPISAQPEFSADLLALAAEVQQRQSSLAANPSFSNNLDNRHQDASVPPSSSPPQPLGTDSNDWEMIVLLRSKQDPAVTQTLVVDRPTPELIDRIQSHRDSLRNVPVPPAEQLADLRARMPEPREPARNFGREVRGQSPTGQYR